MNINIVIEINEHASYIPKETLSLDNWEVLREEIENKLDFTLADILARYDILLTKNSLSVAEFDVEGESKNEY